MLNYVFTPPFSQFPPLPFIYSYHGCPSHNSRVDKVLGLPVLRLNNFFWGFLLGRENDLIRAQFSP